MTALAVTADEGVRAGDVRTTLPTRRSPRGTEPLELLFERPAPLGPTRGGLGGGLASLYAGDLLVPLRPERPTVIANFVETIDGVIALDRRGRTGGGEVSGFSPTDKFVMGVLRAVADVVLVGAGTVRAAEGTGWTADAIDPARTQLHAELRARLGLAPQPTTMIVTASGDVDPAHRALQDPAVPIVVTGPPKAIQRLDAAGFAAHVRLAELPFAEGTSTAGALIELASSLGARVVLSEGGAHLIGELFAARLLDELFVTLSPQVVGRDDEQGRLSLVEGTALWPELPAWATLESVRRAGSHLFLRYGFSSSELPSNEVTSNVR